MNGIGSEIGIVTTVTVSAIKSVNKKEIETEIKTVIKTVIVILTMIVIEILIMMGHSLRTGLPNTRIAEERRDPRMSMMSSTILNLVVSKHTILTWKANL